MRPWRRLAGRRVLHTPIALQLIDDFTSSTPVASIGVALERQSGIGWAPTKIDAVRTVSGLVAYPGLGRAQYPGLTGVQRYRVRLVDDQERNVYRPAYRFTIDGLEFDVSPWNDQQPPAAAINQPETVFLWPGTNYPFSRSIPVLRGRTVDGLGAPLADARITSGIDRVLSDERGAFSMPVRLTTPTASIVVVAEHARSGLNASLTVPLPNGLATAIELQLM